MRSPGCPGGGVLGLLIAGHLGDLESRRRDGGGVAGAAHQQVGIAERLWDERLGADSGWCDGSGPVCAEVRRGSRPAHPELTGKSNRH